MAKKKEKVDYEALNSRLMQIPKMDIASARDLMDIGLKDIFELEGRSPESLFETIKKINPEIEPRRLWYIRMAVYYAENKHELDSKKMTPWAWNIEVHG
jgi:hypothetical protein